MNQAESPARSASASLAWARDGVQRPGAWRWPRWSPPIRWKLILGVGLPLSLLLGGFLRYDFVIMRQRALELARERTSERAERYAAALDADCRAIEQVALATARFLEVHPEPSEAQLYAQLMGNVESNPLIYGGRAPPVCPQARR